MCLFEQKKYEDAIKAFDKAIECSNDNNKILLSDCYYHKGICLLKMNKKEKGFKDFEQAIIYNNKNGEIYNYKAYYYMDKENYKCAIDSYLKAIDINREIYANKIDGYFNIAYCYLQLEKFKDAYKYLILSQKINEEKIKNYFKSGLSACDDGTGIGIQEYLLDFSKIYNDIKNKFIDINYFLGICNLELKKYEEAINNFEICNKYDNKFGDGYYYKGLVYSKLNKYQKAIEQFKKAIECDNNIQIYKQALKNEENKLNILYNKIEKAEIDLVSRSSISSKGKNNDIKKTPIKKIKNKNKIAMCNKSIDLRKNYKSKISFDKIPVRNIIYNYKCKNGNRSIHSIHTVKSKMIKKINLSHSSKELIRINLNGKFSNFEKNERIRNIIKNNNTSKKELQNKSSKKFHKKHLMKQKQKINVDKKNDVFHNKIQNTE
jgi:tetratricopeptide (TPR) repeat protein